MLAVIIIRNFDMTSGFDLVIVITVIVIDNDIAVAFVGFDMPISGGIGGSMLRDVRIEPLCDPARRSRT